MSARGMLQLLVPDAESAVRAAEAATGAACYVDDNGNIFQDDDDAWFMPCGFVQQPTDQQREKTDMAKGRLAKMVDATKQFFGAGADPEAVATFIGNREKAGTVEAIVEQQRDISRQLQAALAAKKRGEIAVDGRAVDFEISRLEAALTAAARRVQDAQQAARNAVDTCPDSRLSSQLSAGRERRRQAIARVAEVKRQLAEAEDDRQKWAERLANAEEVVANFGHEQDKRSVKILTKEVAQADVRIEAAREQLADAERRLKAAEDHINETKQTILGLN